MQRVLAISRHTDGGEAEVTTDVETAIDRSRGRGQSLDTGTRLQMESAFGADFGTVRIHTGAESHALNRAVSAVAFTTGSDIFFRDGAYNPHSSEGRHLLAHELTHVVQQNGYAVQPKLVVGAADNQYEREAESVAEAVEKTLASPKLQEGQAGDAAGAAGIQRCSCGGHAPGGAECKSCRAKRETLTKDLSSGNAEFGDRVGSEPISYPGGLRS
ncbi:MAG: DUF4157 domain-containing protein [Bryobacteraceae bacterium]